MLSSGILDFAIGLVFTFLAVSLAAGAATETVASVFRWRSHTLLEGIKSLLNDPHATALAGELYKHGLINPRSDGTTHANWRTNPAYIDADHFATALFDIIKNHQWPHLPDNMPAPAPEHSPAPAPAATGRSAVDRLNAKIANIRGDRSGQLRKMLYGMVERNQGDEEKIRAALANWFDSSMDRVSGAYKRWAQLWTFIFAFLIAAILNVSTLDVAQQLWKQPVDTKMITAAAAQNPPADYLKLLDTMPIGWSSGGGGSVASGANSGVLAFFNRAPSDWDLTRIGGWLITAFATLFGAPFWFDALQQIVRLKGSGPSPAEKGTSTAAGK